MSGPPLSAYSEMLVRQLVLSHDLPKTQRSQKLADARLQPWSSVGSFENNTDVIDHLLKLLPPRPHSEMPSRPGFPSSFH